MGKKNLFWMKVLLSVYSFTMIPTNVGSKPMWALCGIVWALNAYLTITL